MTIETLNLAGRHEWFSKHRTFGILVSCHPSYADEEWCWCLYALIYDNHPQFNNVAGLVENLPWHGGCTYEERFIQEPARGIRWDWQRKGEFLKIGCDYSHLNDEYYRQSDPHNGIPGSIQSDAQELFDALEARAEEKS